MDGSAWGFLDESLLGLAPLASSKNLSELRFSRHLRPSGLITSRRYCDKGKLTEDQDVDESHYPLWVDENSNEGDSPMSAETIPFEIQVERAGRRD